MSGEQPAKGWAREWQEWLKPQGGLGPEPVSSPLDASWPHWVWVLLSRGAGPLNLLNPQGLSYRLLGASGSTAFLRWRASVVCFQARLGYRAGIPGEQACVFPLPEPLPEYLVPEDLLMWTVWTGPSESFWEPWHSSQARHPGFGLVLHGVSFPAYL